MSSPNVSSFRNNEATMDEKSPTDRDVPMAIFKGILMVAMPKPENMPNQKNTFGSFLDWLHDTGWRARPDNDNNMPCKKLSGATAM
mmetsp:Transcript_22606/g.51793  ORF Transcript_22606/g.51793 Transcript_22606/m.51793 type:complete len:86 (-) Transcript_22606:207-464(-)